MNSENVYFPTSTEKPDPSWGEVAKSNFPLYGSIPSLYIGVHAGWRVAGKNYSHSDFTAHIFPGCFTGCRPVGLTPLFKL